MSDEQQQSGLDRKTYEPPELKRLGSVEALTNGPRGGTIDALAGGTGGFQDPVS